MPNYVGAQARLDYSGARGGLRRPLSKRDPVFPYDKETSYGSPNGYDKSLSQGKDAQDNPIVPKNTEHSIWDDMDEAMGTPQFLSKADGQGGLLGGRVAPGTIASFAYYSDDEEMPDKELSKYGEEKMWDKIKEAFVSLRDTPEGQMTLSQGIEEAELEAVCSEFETEAAKAEKYIDDCNEVEAVKFLIDLDPDHLAKHVAQSGKDSIKGIYKKWVDGPDVDDEELP